MQEVEQRMEQLPSEIREGMLVVPRISLRFIRATFEDQACASPLFPAIGRKAKQGFVLVDEKLEMLQEVHTQ